MEENNNGYSPLEMTQKTGYKDCTVRRIAALFEKHHQYFVKRVGRRRSYDDYALSAILLYKCRVDELGEQGAVKYALRIIYNIRID